MVNLCLFLWPPWLNHAYSGIVLKDLFTLHKLADEVVLDR